MTEWLTGVDVGQVHFDHRQFTGYQRIADRHRGVCPGGRVDDDAGAALAGAVNPVEQFAFVVGLAKLHGQAEFFGGAPAQGSTGVETAPIFRWKTGGASDKEALLLLVLDRTQAEGKSFQWQSDVSGKTSAVYDNDGRALTPYLQPFHAYDWQMAGMTYNTDQTAFSIGADFFNALGIVSNPVKGGPVNEFVTGGY